MKIDFNKTAFLKSAYKTEEFPADFSSEIAFVGRSNSGKSSAINALTKQKNLARASKTPGRTQLINFFQVIEGLRLVDLPGYGFAKVPPKMQQYWQKLIQEYFQTRESLKGVVVLMDSRHPLSILDQELIHWIMDQELPLVLLLSKIDKLNKQESQQSLNKVNTWLKECGYLSTDPQSTQVRVIPFSVNLPPALDKLAGAIAELT